ncbi:hypothetical protein QVD17_30286 [Tagetes erecta]|uniref:Uncharacterized protein n=1 Tax=Tagetes erecta TaxID=13708 RepID=A0AAD8NFW2_TARER|nr:hypothetical protein QVD17_30286 [Tagetes erecta]
MFRQDDVINPGTLETYKSLEINNDANFLVNEKTANPCSLEIEKTTDHYAAPSTDKSSQLVSTDLPQAQPTSCLFEFEPIDPSNIQPSPTGSLTPPITQPSIPDLNQSCSSSSSHGTSKVSTGCQRAKKKKRNKKDNSNKGTSPWSIFIAAMDTPTNRNNGNKSNGENSTAAANISEIGTMVGFGMEGFKEEIAGLANEMGVLNQLQ